MKKLILIFSFVIFFTGIGFTTQWIYRNNQLTVIGNNIEKIDNSHYGTQGNYEIGKGQDTSHSVNVYRTYFNLGLGAIPANATIDTVFVDYSTDGGGYTLKLTNIQNLSTDNGANWGAIGSSNALHSGLVYNTDGSFISSPVKTAVQNALANRQIIIGALSENENTRGSQSLMSLTLRVYYKYPAAQLEVYIRNDLYGVQGGEIGAAIYPATAVRGSSPITISNAYEGNKLNLTAYDNQNVNGKTWFFNDTEYPQAPLSNWKKDLGGNLTPLGTSASFTTPALEADDDEASFKAYLITTSYTTNGTLSTDETWFTNVTLTGNVYVPLGKTLTINSDITVNLVNGSNRYSIISTGGSIVDNGATINGCRASLTANSTLRGLCGTIQAAATNAGSTNEIYLENGNFNENVSIYNKYNLSILGNQNYKPFGSLTITSCNAFEGMGFGAKNVYINYGSNILLYDINAYGTDQSTIGFYLYYSDTYDMSYLTSEYSRLGISCSDGTEADIEVSFLYDNLAGLGSYNGSNVNIYNSYFCGTALDLTTYNFSSILAFSCYFDGGIPSISGSNILHSRDRSCSYSKASSNQLTENNMDNIEGSEFEKINSAYFSLNKKLAKAFKEKTDFNKEAFCTDYDKVIKDFKAFIDKNPESPLAKVALVASAKSYRRIDDLRGKNDFTDMKNLLSGIIEKSEYSALKPQAERLMIEYYRLKKDFIEAIETADNIIEKYKEDSDYLCGVLYAKGLIQAYDLNKTDKAIECFSSIVQKYPENSIALLAENELGLLGVDASKIVKEKPTVNSNQGFSTSSYPNPFNPTTIINYTLPDNERVVIKVYDILGREIKELVNEQKTAGTYSVEFDGSNLSSGVYFYTITAGNFSQTKKMMLTK